RGPSAPGSRTPAPRSRPGPPARSWRPSRRPAIDAERGVVVSQPPDFHPGLGGGPDDLEPLPAPRAGRGQDRRVGEPLGLGPGPGDGEGPPGSRGTAGPRARSAVISIRRRITGGCTE